MMCEACGYSIPYRAWFSNWGKKLVGDGSLAQTYLPIGRIWQMLWRCMAKVSKFFKVIYRGVEERFPCDVHSVETGVRIASPQPCFRHDDGNSLRHDEGNIIYIPLQLNDKAVGQNSFIDSGLTPLRGSINALMGQGFRFAFGIFISRYLLKITWNMNTIKTDIFICAVIAGGPAASLENYARREPWGSTPPLRASTFKCKKP